MASNLASERQVQAASPTDSTWLSANAGSGKTRVLTDRVARLLLDSVLPQHILCLTYTKAAASEMQNRLFARLGSWAMLETENLKADLVSLGFEGTISEAELREARRLFARAIEAPGGLKIQTIHSFCASLLRRFPLEAGVSPQFVEMDERAANILREEVVDEMILGTDRAEVDAVASLFSDQDFSKLTYEITKHSQSLSEKADAETIWESFGLSKNFTRTELEAQAFLPSDAQLLKNLMPLLAASGANDQKAHARLSGVNLDALSIDDLSVLSSIFLTGKGAKEPFTAKINSFPTKAVREQFDDGIEALNNFMMRIEDAREIKNSLYAAQKSLAMRNFAFAFLPRYQKKKLWRGWLDFDDLILKARDLLTDPHVAQWVLYRLDGGIDHILVDEAQDTSPAQWSVIENLAQEFTSGDGARSDLTRTIFVVGDKKQSIYSFQGADPAEFDRMRLHFKERLTQVGVGLQTLQLEHSFRSSGSILSVVDHSFDARNGHGVGGEMHHIAFKNAMPGRVDHWPMVEPIDDQDDRHWSDPVDQISQEHHSVKLAEMIADKIRQMIDESVTIPVEIGNSGRFEQRPVTEGDFLILVQGRSDLFHEIIRACKAKDLAMAGADRFLMGASLAVADITALLSFLATPEDDLSLAALLRSPLMNWTEQQLFDLAHKRSEKFLWRALQIRAEEFPETVKELQELRDLADYLRPYELIERCLTDYKGRKNLISRLGAEAEEGIDALLNQALNFEKMEIPSLTGFLTWLQSEDVEIKRQMDSASNQIRVMTVHGAKGLEAPIVILPDTANKANKVNSDFIRLENGQVTWRTGADEMPSIMTAALDRSKDLQAQEKMRLLYVAMTRAEKWLIACGAGKVSREGTSWHQLIEEGMKQAGAVSHKFPSGLGLRFQQMEWTSLPYASSEGSREKQSLSLPKWAVSKASAPTKAANVLSPSELGGAKALGGEGGLSEPEALQRGSAIHLLLEHLPSTPRDGWEKRSEHLIGPDYKDHFDEVEACLTNQNLAFLFEPSTLSEVTITAELDELENAPEMLGIIDRLVFQGDDIHVVDFKTNATVPKSSNEVPEGLLRQMGAYLSALEKIYPDRNLIPSILWTKSASLMQLERSKVKDALLRTLTS